ncbi:MAG: hypothetical protein JO224_11120 [Pelomonas sp.]|nr:hypothetical protein [Roseateles sp.]
MLLERLIAAIGLAVCIALGLQMVMPLRWRARLVAWTRDPFGLKARRRARAAAEDAIRRAQRRQRWKGNVYRLGDDGGGGEDEEPPRTLH